MKTRHAPVLLLFLAASCALWRAGASQAFREGFEDGVGGWEGGANMAVDPAVAHGGARSLRLAVADPMHDAVYATRKIPVEGGARYAASCFVKTVDVVEAPGAKPSAGAGLIVEWADQDGNWMKGGEYACGLRGTADWRRVECGSLKAPERAGYAILFLTLRDAGKAWFDDIALERLDASVEKVSPENGAVLANNCPLFAWRPTPGVRAYTVELSQDPAFAAGAALSFAAGAALSFAAGGLPRLQLREPLAPGVWHWRVVATGLPDARPWSFTQTAPQERDCLPPLVAAKAARITRGDEPFTVEVEGGDLAVVRLLFGEQGEATASVQQQETTASVQQQVGRDGKRATARFAPPDGGWPAGLTEAAIIAEDAAGNASTNAFWLLNAPAPAKAVTIGGDGFFHENGRRFFPLGIYEVEPEDMADVAAAGFDIVHNYRWEKSQDDASCRAWLDACAANGLRAFVGFDRGIRSGDGMVQGNLGCVARRVGAVADHPGLFCWYLFDEPEWITQFIAPDLLEEFAGLVRALDPYHPVVMSTWDATMKQYRRTWDTHWTQAYGGPAEVVAQLDEHRRFLNGESPITLLVNCNDGAQSKRRQRGIEPDPAAFARDLDHLRACAFLGVAKECNGVVWWWFGRGSREFYSAAQCPKAWEDMKAVVAELRALRPIVEADGPVEAGTACDGDAKVVWWRKRVDGETWFVAVNTADRSAAVTLDGRKLELHRHEVRVLNERNEEMKTDAKRSPASAWIMVDPAEELGPIKPMHAVNNGPAVPPVLGDQLRGNFEEYRAARIPFARTHDSVGCVAGGSHACDISAIFPDFDADENDPANYDFVFTDHYLDTIRRAGTRVFFRLGQSIEHGPKKYGVLPPKDFAKWARICEHVIRHYNEGWGWGADTAWTTSNVAWADQYGIEYWEIWNEPDLDPSDGEPPRNPRCWGGTAEEFFALYETASKHLKAAFPHLKIGGPALCGRLDWGERFLAHCRDHASPLDFFSWHVYATEPKTIADRCSEVRALLDRHGFTKTESILNEWNYVKGWTDEWVYSLEVESGRFNQKGAAFVMATMADCQSRPLDMLMFYDARVGSGMNNLFDKTTLWPLKGYYPFYAWSKLAALGTQVACSVAEERVESSGAHTGAVLERGGREADGSFRAVAAKDGHGSCALVVARYSNDNNETAVKTVRVSVPGVSLRDARCHVTDAVRTYTEVPLAPEDGGTALLRLQPNSFAVVEW